MAYTTINKSSDYFNTKLWTGTESSNSITGVGFQPDMVWIKNRSTTHDHRLLDAVRGVPNLIYPSTTDSAGNDGNAISSLDSDGFTVGSSTAVNGNGNNLVAWNWKANGAGSSNTDGSITSTVSANTTAGFSIVSYTGTGSAATIGHGLGVAPACIIFKTRNTTSDWFVYHQSTGATNRTKLNQTVASSASTFIDNTAPSSTVFNTEGGGATGTNGNTYIAYCFAEKTGYSKFSSYTGAGSNLPFIYTGFKPAFLILKRTDATGYNWVLSDAVRDVDNPVLKYVHPNTNDAEQSGSRDIDFLSNGFKFRNSNTTWNASGGSYIYMAFAEAPLVGTNNIPCTAR